MTKKNYGEGSFFAIPLESDGYAVGLAARTTPRGAVILAYFFGTRYASTPEMSDVATLRLKDSIKVMQVGDLGLIKGEWKVIGQLPNWDRSEWPMPNFLRREPISERLWVVTYSDDDPETVVSERLISEVEAVGLEPDVLSGYKAAEKKLSAIVE